jgi:hypothetical protein
MMGRQGSAIEVKHALLALTMSMWGCGGAPDVPSDVAAELGSREIVAFEEQALGGVPTLVLAYGVPEPVLEAWQTIESDVAKVSPRGGLMPIGVSCARCGLL